MKQSNKYCEVKGALILQILYRQFNGKNARLTPSLQAKNRRRTYVLIDGAISTTFVKGHQHNVLS